ESSKLNSDAEDGEANSTLNSERTPAPVRGWKSVKELIAWPEVNSRSVFLADPIGMKIPSIRAYTYTCMRAMHVRRILMLFVTSGIGRTCAPLLEIMCGHR
ncbi:hypothetical protein X777_06356, partial [Ooceraea biroi]